MRAILTWHSIDRSGSPISATPEEFRGQLAWLAEAGVRVLPLAELAADTGGGDAVALTFDDGFTSFATEVVPLLEERAWPVTLFVVSDHVGRDNRWAGATSTVVPRLPLLDWDGLAALPDELVRIEAHTRTHPHLDAMTSEAQLDDELGACAATLAARLGRTPTVIAYPYGGHNAAVVRVAARHFQWGCTTDLRALRTTEDPHRLPRIDAYYLRAPERLGRWGSPRLAAWLALRRGGRRLRALLPAREWRGQ